MFQIELVNSYSWLYSTFSVLHGKFIWKIWKQYFEKFKHYLCP